VKRWIFIGAVFFVLLIITSYDNDTKIKKHDYKICSGTYVRQRTYVLL